MNREIEKDGFITRAEDLRTTTTKSDAQWEMVANRLDNLIPPPPFGSVFITEDGLVLMCKGTYKMLCEGKEVKEDDNGGDGND